MGNDEMKPRYEEHVTSVNSVTGRSAESVKPVPNLKIQLLYKTFQMREWNYRVVECSNILQDFASTFVERTFEEFIDKFSYGNDIHEPTNELTDKLDAELRKTLIVDGGLHLNFSLHTQLALKAALKCLSYHERYHAWNFTWYWNGRFADNIRSLSVQVLLDIMWNCNLFGDVRDNIDAIIDAYVECDSSESEFDSLTNKLKSIMKAFINKIDDKLLPYKVRFLEQLTNMKGCWDKNSMQTGANKVTSDIVQDGSVSSVVSDLQNPRFINWVKGSFSLKYLNEGARYFILWKFQFFQKYYLPENGSHFDDGENIKRMCNQGVECTSGQWKYPKYRSHCKICEALFEKVLLYHRNLIYKAGFHNCKDTPVDGAWGIAKLFMPGNCRLVVTPKDADTHALFQLILNCRLFSQLTDADIEKIVEMRNTMMHSPDFTIEENPLEELYVSELNFLEEAIKLTHDEQVRQKLTSSKDNIAKIRASVTTYDTFLERGKAATEFQYEELKKANDREDNETYRQLQARQIERLQFKHACYINIQNSPSLSIQFRNVVLDTNINMIHQLKEELYALEKKNKELGDKLQMNEKRVCADPRNLMYHV